jgi:hypothetical protein
MNNPFCRITGNGTQRFTNVDNTLSTTFGNLGYNSLIIDNSGLIEVQTGTLTIDPVDGSTFTNSGTLQAINGGTLEFLNAHYDNTHGVMTANDGHLYLRQGTYDNTGSTISADGPTSTVTLSGSLEGGLLTAVNGGTLILSGGSLTASLLESDTTVRVEDGSVMSITADGTLDAEVTLETLGSGVINCFAAILPSGFTIHEDLDINVHHQFGQGYAKIEGILNNLGTLDLIGNGGSYVANLWVTGDTQLTGGGILTMNNPFCRITGNGTQRFTNVDNTLSTTYGNLGYNSLIIDNSGLIEVQTGTLTIDPVDGSWSCNSSLIRAFSNGTIAMGPGWIDNRGGRMLSDSNGRIELNAATMIKNGILETHDHGLFLLGSSTLEDVALNGAFHADDPTILAHLYLSGSLSMGSFPLTISSGTRLSGPGQLVGNLALSGQYGPGGNGSLSDIDGNLTCQSSAEVRIGLAADMSQKLVISGELNCAGALRVIPVNGYVPPVGEPLELIQAGLITGQFDTAIFGHCQVEVTYEAQRLLVTFPAPAPLPDFDANGRIDLLDAINQMTLFGICASCDEDLDCNGEVDIEDVTMCLSHWRAEP